MALTLTEPQWRMLAGVAAGFAWDDHVHRPGQRAQAQATRQALASRGLLDQLGQLTAKGTRALVDRAVSQSRSRESLSSTEGR